MIRENLFEYWVSKIGVYGAPCVGKKTLLHKMNREQNNPDPNPTRRVVFPIELIDIPFTLVLEIGSDFDNGCLKVDNECDGFVLIYAIDDRKSFEKIRQYHSEIGRIKGKSTFPCLIFGNKRDLENQRVVTKEEGEALSAELNCVFYEVCEKYAHMAYGALYDLPEKIRDELIALDKKEYKEHETLVEKIKEEISDFDVRAYRSYISRKEKNSNKSCNII
jgi:GTPase SAR1 family protein